MNSGVSVAESEYNLITKMLGAVKEATKIKEDMELRTKSRRNCNDERVSAVL